MSDSSSAGRPLLEPGARLDDAVVEHPLFPGALSFGQGFSVRWDDGTHGLLVFLDEAYETREMPSANHELLFVGEPGVFSTTLGDRPIVTFRDVCVRGSFFGARDLPFRRFVDNWLEITTDLLTIGCFSDIQVLTESDCLAADEGSMIASLWVRRRDAVSRRAPGAVLAEAIAASFDSRWQGDEVTNLSVKHRNVGTYLHRQAGNPGVTVADIRAVLLRQLPLVPRIAEYLRISGPVLIGPRFAWLNSTGHSWNRFLEMLRPVLEHPYPIVLLAIAGLAFSLGTALGSTTAFLLGIVGGFSAREIVRHVRASSSGQVRADSQDQDQTP